MGLQVPFAPYLLVKKKKKKLYWVRHGGQLNTVTKNETGLASQLKSAPLLPTQPIKSFTKPSGCTSPTLYGQQCGSFYVPQESE